MKNLPKRRPGSQILGGYIVEKIVPDNHNKADQNNRCQRQIDQTRQNDHRDTKHPDDLQENEFRNTENPADVDNR